VPGKKKQLVALASALLAALVLAPAAHGYIYWADPESQTLGRAANDGGEVNAAFIHTGEQPFAVTVDAAHIYWVNESSDSIGRANIDGTGVNNSFITGINEPDGIAVNGSSIFWATIPGPIGRADLNGSNVNKNFISQAVQPCGLALDSGHLYWADEALAEAKVGRSSLDGLFVQPEYVKIGAAFPCGVAVNSANIFWADTGFLGGGTRIGRADLATGKSVDPSFIGGASTPCGMAIDSSSHLYWANAETSTIARANTDGTGVDQSFIEAGGKPICGVAVDNLSTPPPPPSGGGESSGGSSGGGGGGSGGGTPPDTEPPRTKITKGPGNKLARGKAKFSFRSNEAGPRFVCKLDKSKPKPCASPKTYKGLKPGHHTFKVWAIDAAGNKAVTPAKRSFKAPA
jgi:streptogramin lyase